MPATIRPVWVWDDEAERKYIEQLVEERGEIRLAAFKPADQALWRLLVGEMKEVPE
jgi:hypothetical protein